MMRSWKIFFSRGIPKRNFDIRRFDSHHQFHSFFHLDDHHSFYDRHHSIKTSTTSSLTQQRFQTTNINRGRGKVSPEGISIGIDEQLRRMKENVKKREFDKFLNQLDQFSRTAAALTQNQNQQIISTLKEWNRDGHSDREYAYIFKSLANLKFSVTNQEQRDIVVAIADGFFAKGQFSFRWFALFLTGLRRLKYSGSLLNEKHRRQILELLGQLKKDNSHEGSYTELLSGLVGLGIHWDEINEDGKKNLLNQLEVLKSKFTSDIYQVLFSFGKLGVSLKESHYEKTILELTVRTLKEIEKDNGQGMIYLEW
jgi:hypothetical protein